MTIGSKKSIFVTCLLPIRRRLDMNYTKDSVHIRKKKLSNGNVSLYLDIYSNGVRVYEFLKLYLVPDIGKKSKLQNKETLHEAEIMRIQKLAEISRNPLQSNKNKTNLCWFVRNVMSRKKKGTARVYQNVLCIAEAFFGKNFFIEDITEDKIREFFRYIGTVPNKNKPGRTLSNTTQWLYCNIFNAILNVAADEHLIGYDISKHIKTVQKDESERQYLTIDEVRLLVNSRLTKTYRRAFLFSCFTGLRESDIENLRWNDVEEHDGVTRIIFRQKKTSSVEYLDISPQARKMMGDRKDGCEKVFNRFHCSDKTNKAIRSWIESVGIKKYMTFHCARHTFATMMLTLDTDLYTTSKLLGHKSIQTTQIYAKIVDKKKQEAVTKIPIII